MCRCLGKAFLTFLTLSTIGAVTLAITALFVAVRVQHLYLVDDTVDIGLTVALAASGAVLLLAIAGACCGGRCLRTALAIIYLVFAAGLAAVGILFSQNRDNIVPDLEKFWTSSDTKTAHAIETSFHCKCFDNETCYSGEEPPSDANETCAKKIKDVIDASWKWVLWVSVGLAGLLVIAAILVLICVHCCDRGSDHGAGIQYGSKYTLI
jgi:hypothetical protein